MRQRRTRPFAAGPWREGYGTERVWLGDTGRMLRGWHFLWLDSTGDRAGKGVSEICKSSLDHKFQSNQVEVLWQSKGQLADPAHFSQSRGVS